MGEQVEQPRSTFRVGPAAPGQVLIRLTAHDGELVFDNARIDYRGFALDLRTDRPSPRQIRRAVARVLGDPSYRERVALLSKELATYDPFAIIERTVTGESARPAAS
jgi:UDP:flavonoid glycosyltransferase YjiC (YdhE family)